jgi:DNA primase
MELPRAPAAELDIDGRRVAGVSTPLTWDEVETALRRGSSAALDFRPAAVLERIANHGDLFMAAARTLPVGG